jgi:uncharacterized protein (TIGR02118 family)
MAAILPLSKDQFRLSCVKAGILAQRNINPAMISLFITYTGTPADRFDRDYYVSTHLPLVRHAWTSLGLVSIDGYFPSGTGAGFVAVIVCSFRDEAAMQAAFASPELPAIMADVANFTALTPTFGRMVPL